MRLSQDWERGWLLTLLLVGLTGCSLKSTDCNIEEPDPKPRSGNAGCLISRDGEILLIRHQPSGKIGLPGGTARSGESAQCTAYRETLEETGLAVSVGKFVTQMDTGFLVYACRTEGGQYPIPVPAGARWEVQEIFWADPDQLGTETWRFPTQLDEIRRFMRDDGAI